MDGFYVENLEEIELNQFEENVSDIESVNIAPTIQENTINSINFTEKKNIKW